MRVVPNEHKKWGDLKDLNPSFEGFTESTTWNILEREVALCQKSQSFPSPNIRCCHNVSALLSIPERLRVLKMMGLKCWEFMHQSDQGVCIVNSRLEKIYTNEQANKIFAVGGRKLYRQFEYLFTQMFRMITAANTALCNYSGILIHSNMVIHYHCFSFQQGTETFLFMAFDDRPNTERAYFQPIAFTPREKEILQAIAQGKTNKQISTMLCVGLETVKSHLRNLFTKVGVRSRAELIARVQIAGSTVNQPEE